MGVAHKYKISKSQLLANWTLEDVFDASEYMDIQAAIEDEQRKQSEKESKKTK